MKDFTLSSYELLLNKLLEENYTFFTLKDIIEQWKTFSPSQNHPITLSLCILRHDVDRLPHNALKMAKVETDLNIKSTYYFRTKPCSFNTDVIEKISDFGHEIGYHYENMDTCNGNKELAIEDFKLNLEKFRKLYPVKTICMHGSPLSKYDNRDLWRQYNYRDFDIIAEPYFDIDYNKVLYITDAGRSWNNENINRRDKVDSKFNYIFNHTDDIIEAIKNNKLPDKIMINIHPEHWSETKFEWFKIYFNRKLRNTVKKILLRKS